MLIKKSLGAYGQIKTTELVLKLALEVHAKMIKPLLHVNNSQ